MTERKSLESERALATALADRLEPLQYAVGVPFTYLEYRMVIAALRSLAAQDQKPVAWVCFDKVERKSYLVTNLEDAEDKQARGTVWDVTPLFTAPPPAAGWDEAIEAAVSLARRWRDEAAEFSDPKAQLQRNVCQSISVAIEALRHNAPPDTGAGKSEQPAVLTYTNYRGETSVRSIIPRSVRYGSTEWHPEPQWLLLAHDTEKNADREFALKDLGVPDHGGADAGVGVKPLEWAGLRAETPFGVEYRVDFYNTGKWKFVYNEDLRSEGSWDTDVQAIAAAQADYERRILSALSHQPAPVATNASAEARRCLRDAVEYIEMAENRLECEDCAQCVDVARSYLVEARKTLSTQPHASDASTEARLREALKARIAIIRSNADQHNWKRGEGAWNRAFGEISGLNFALEALSTHPHASDCDKQGER